MPTGVLFVFVKTFTRVYARFALGDVTFEDFRDAAVERSRIGCVGARFMMKIMMF